MESQEILKHILPEEFVLHFDLTNMKTEGEQLVFTLDEKNEKPPEHHDKELESKGFLESIQILDFPIRDKGVILRVRRRKWKDKQTGKTYTRDWNLKEKGTSYTKGFAAFLKEIHR